LIKLRGKKSYFLIFNSKTVKIPQKNKPISLTTNELGGLLFHTQFNVNNITLFLVNKYQLTDLKKKKLAYFTSICNSQKYSKLFGNKS